MSLCSIYIYEFFECIFEVFLIVSLCSTHLFILWTWLWVIVHWQGYVRCIKEFYMCQWGMFIRVFIWPLLGATGIALHFSGVTCLFLEFFPSFPVLSLDIFKRHVLSLHTRSGDYQMQWAVVVNCEKNILVTYCYTSMIGSLFLVAGLRIPCFCGMYIT